MARVYSSRIMLDPSVLQNMNQVNQQRYQNEVARRQSVLSPMRDLIKSAGKTFDDSMAQYNREQEVSKWDIGTDPVANAAREEYIRTGSSQPLMSYQMQKMAAEQRAADAAKTSAEKAMSDAYHRAVRIAQARPEYAKTQKAMLDAVDAGDMETADILQKSLQAYETEFGADTFGQDSASVLAARQESARKAQNLAMEEAADKREQEEKAAKSYDVKNWIIENIIPLGAIKSKTEQIEIADFIRNSKGLTDADRKELLDRVNAGKTQEEKITENVQTAVAQKAGEKVGKKIDETTNKANAKKYDGQTLVGADWKSIPDDEKKYLSRDANGVVKYIGG